MEIILTTVVRKLGETVTNIAMEQKSLLLNFKKDFEWLRSKLIYVTGYLQPAHDLKNELVKKWFADLQDIALDAEDIVEECACTSDSLFFRYKMGRRIKELKDRMNLVMKEADNLIRVHVVHQFDQVSTSHGSRGEEFKKSSLVERDARPVSINAKVEHILGLLEDDGCQVIAIIGMGGIGKTFLLQNVYNHHKVRQRFEKAIWLSISQTYSVGGLQYDIASHLDLKINNVSEQRAAELIYQKLKDVRSLIVLDDVWRVQGVDSLIQRLGIPGAPCKVVVTTRSIDVCNIMGASPYHMELLSKQDSWILFCLHAFPDQNRPSQELQKVACQVERECGRLPLAVKTIAASMANEKRLSTWEVKLRQLKTVSGAEDPIIPILRLSYNALPSELKPCFLYFSFFGEDETIDAESLIYLWIGESFIPGGEEQWATGWSYLKQLNNLCLIEVSSDRNLKKSCRIHDLLRDLVIYISKENKCAFTVEEASGNGCRRIFLAKKNLDYAGIKNSGFKCPPSLRTLSLANNRIKKFPAKSLSGVRVLRVIDLSNTGLFWLPWSIGNLKLLRVLDLSNTCFMKVPVKPYYIRVEAEKRFVPRFRSVPDCVRNLKNLCFLNISTYPLPKWIGDLKCLQHLHVESVKYSRGKSRGMSKLVSLRTLRSNGRLIQLVLKDVAKLIHLQELHIHIANEKEEGSLEEGVLAQLVTMRHLAISGWFGVSRLPEKMKTMKDLQHLLLISFDVPRWICEYGNLRVLKLRSCQWSEYPAFETMPNLMHLELSVWKREGEGVLPESFGKAGAFPELRYLLITEFVLPDLQHGAMPRMEEFIVDCGVAQKIPRGFEHLTSLKLLSLLGINFGFEERERLDYWSKIKASNPHVTIKMESQRLRRRGAG